MAEFDSSQIKHGLVIDEKYYNTLDIGGFSQMMGHPSFCYKFYWLEAIVLLISRGINKATFDDVINEMICNAWYSVREFHIHLSGIQEDGQVRDGLERTILKLSELSELRADASPDEILNNIHHFDKCLKESKEQLTNMVPYYALTGFFIESERYDDWKAASSIRRKVAYIEAYNRDVGLLPYTLGDSQKLKKEIRFDPKWMQMIQDNTSVILGWIQFEKLRWLQNNNPEIPGLVYKLKAINDKDKSRKLNQVRKLWGGILNLTEVEDVFTGAPVSAEDYDVDHFIPWSFVMNDELWNLMPMDSSLNSSKNNRLPKWDRYFKKFAENQFLLYGYIHELPGIHKLFEACYRDNLHSIWAGQELYRKGNSKEEFFGILEKNMQPVYDSAKRQGYEVWNRDAK